MKRYFNFSVFIQARIKLTLWYLVIIMFVSTIFSLILYQGLNLELVRSFHKAEKILEKKLGQRGVRQQTQPLDENNWIQSWLMPSRSQELNYFAQDYQEARKTLIFRLIIFNLIILIFSAGASYLMASKSLKPIKIAMDKQQEFIRNVSHELRTPLAALQTALEVNLSDPNLPVQIKEMIEDNLQDVKYLKNLSERLLNIIKYNSTAYRTTLGSRENSIKVSFAQDKIKAIMQKFKLLAKKDDKTIKLVFDQEIHEKQNATIFIDELAFQELLYILLDNALKYTQKGNKITVQFGCQAAVTQTLFYLKVSDTGIGISQDNLDKIFERFYQIETSRVKQNNNNRSGYGLGLSLAKEIVTAYQGKIMVDSEVGQGSKFTVFFS